MEPYDESVRLLREEMACISQQEKSGQNGKSNRQLSTQDEDIYHYTTDVLSEVTNLKEALKVAKTSEKELLKKLLKLEKEAEYFEVFKKD